MAEKVEHLPVLFVNEFKWLCFRASEAAASFGRGNASDASRAVMACLVHGFAIDRASCVSLTAQTRNLLQRLALLSLPAFHNGKAQEEYLGCRRSLAEAPELAPILRDHLVDLAQATAELFEAQVGRRALHRECGNFFWSRIARIVWASWGCYWKRPPWRGANLGGWLLLEPGPSHDLWDEVASHQRQDGEEKEEEEEEQEGGEEAQDEENSEDEAEEEKVEDIEDEHGLCEHLGDRCQEIIDQHRAEWLSKDDFQWLKDHGFNSVRIPFGYWIVTGPTEGDQYIGPALQYIDQAVALAEQFSFQVVLDMHGNPGGESGEPPCGCKWDDWTEDCWRRNEALAVLARLAKRYACRSCVTGLQVANEPSQSCDMERLCDWYQRAIETIRKEGMTADKVAIVLPVFWYDRLGEFLSVWLARGNFMRYDNIALDLHLYQCFGEGWEMLDHREHLRVTQRHGRILQSLPCAMVGEWSLARPAHVFATDEMEKEFGQAQLSAYAAASHGWFFWNYYDQCDHWDLKTCVEKGWLPAGLRCSRAQGQGTADVAGDRCMPRISAPGDFPQCYGPDEFSQLPRPSQGLDAAALEDLRLRAESLAEATGRQRGEAAEALMKTDGDVEAASAQLLRLSSAERLAEATACSRKEALEALQKFGTEERAACHLLDVAAERQSSEQRGQKRGRDAVE